MTDLAPATATLADLEATIERGLAHFMEVGGALMEIRDRDLYRETHRTFDAYLRERWGIRGARAYQLITATEIVKQLSTAVDTSLPITERQARELARLPEARRPEVWQEAVERHGERVTAQHIRQIADEEQPAYDPDPPLLSIIDVETGAVISRPADRTNGHAAPPTDPAQIELERRRRSTAYFADSVTKLWGVTMDHPEGVVEDWLPDANPHAGIPHYAFLWTPEGQRRLANSFNRIADALEARGGTLL